MFGGAGNDVYFVDNAGDVVIENANEGNDTVYASIHFGLSANVENLVLQGSDNLQGYGNNGVNTLFGNTGNNLLNGEGGADLMRGGLGNDVYFVDNSGDLVFENLNEGTDAVFASVNYTLTANVETLVLQGAGNLTGTGNISPTSSSAMPARTRSMAEAGPTGSRAMPATIRSCSMPGKPMATPSWILRARRRRRRLAEFCRLRHGR